MKFTIENDSPITYIRIQQGDVRVAQTIRVHEEIIIDVDSEGKLVGLEIL